MCVIKTKDTTKDGRRWIFKVTYKTYDGKKKQYSSRKFHTKKEAEEAKMVFILEKKKWKGRKIMNVKELCDAFYSYQKNKVKNTTLYTYVQRRKYFKLIEGIKLHELTVEDYKVWRNSLDDSKLSTAYKNDILKFFKELLKYAERWYGYDFRDLYNKFDKFRDPNAIIDESINYYTYDEFKKFNLLCNKVLMRYRQYQRFMLQFYC